MTWTSGSASRSIIVLSSSVSSPAVVRSISLPRSRDRSWTRRRKRPNSEPIGTMRMPIIASRSAEVRRSISSATPLVPPPAEASWVSRAWAMTSSPTRSIISSSRSAGTRMVEVSIPPARLADVSRRSAGMIGVRRRRGRRRLRKRGGGLRRCGRRRGRRRLWRCDRRRQPSTASTFSSMSSATNMKTSSMALRGCAMVEDDFPFQVAARRAPFRRAAARGRNGPSPGSRRGRAARRAGAADCCR